jgi:hypothetical protein
MGSHNDANHSVGSYGGLPILSVSPDGSEENHVINILPRKKRKGKGRLADNEPVQSQWSHRNEHQSTRQLVSGIRASATSRRRAQETSRSSSTLENEADDLEGVHLKARFDASGSDHSTTGVPQYLGSEQSSSSSTNLDEDEASDDEDLHDVKGNLSDDSPSSQVRASVAVTDNTALSIDTPRMWFLSILFAIAGSSTNLFFSLRYPSVSLTPIIALLLVHPLGLLWDQFLKRADDPKQNFLDGSLQKSSHSPETLQHNASWKRRLRLWLSQGRWNEKEHCCVYVSSNVSFGFAFATDVCLLPTYTRMTH